ncbi:MAG: histidinol-phosphatase HisJ family protein [Oscillospiraceae bacterium]|nr:histidinol-phosphatase HisJ family protein [Oscillospiraceae bacterium]
MFLADYHVHSDISLDSDASMYEMALAEAAAGMQQMCFTNHMDMVDWVDFLPVPVMPTAAYETVRRYEYMRARHGEPLDIRLGVELGEAIFNPQMAAEAAQSPGLDFVMGSLHVLPQEGDFYYIDYKSREHCEALYDEYMDKLIEIAKMDFFDVMAHVGYCRRDMSRRGFDVKLTLERWGDKVEQLFKILIANGRGIEINCSGIRDGLEAFPDESILRLYKSLGGEIITVGSDAHRPEDAGKCVREGYELAKRCGFKYVTTFRRRKPEFVAID